MSHAKILSSRRIKIKPCHPTLVQGFGSVNSLLWGIVLGVVEYLAAPGLDPLGTSSAPSSQLLTKKVFRHCKAQRGSKSCL